MRGTECYPCCSPCQARRVWCPRHLAGRLFAVVVHDDAEGAESVRRGLSDWLRSLELISAGHKAELDRYQAVFDQNPS